MCSFSTQCNSFIFKESCSKCADLALPWSFRHPWTNSLHDSLPSLLVSNSSNRPTAAVSKFM